MSKLSVRIATPCPESWANMKPTEEGRFCENCQKAVVDFTAMTDGEMIRVMSQRKGHSCGRFRAEQLGRPLRTFSAASHPTQQRLFGLLTAGLLSWQTTSAQASAPKTGEKSPVHVTDGRKKDQSPSNPSHSVTPVDSSRIITGRVVAQSDGSDLKGVSVIIKGYNKGATTDATGTFQLVVPAEYTADPVVLTVSFIGFVRHEVSVNLNQQRPLQIALAEDSVLLGEVIVVGNYKEPTFLDRLRSRLPASH